MYFEKAMEFGPPTSILWRDFGVHLEHFDYIADELQDAPGAKPLSPTERKEIDDLRRQAEFAFRQSLELNPDDPGALSGLGWIFYKRSDFSEAIKYYSSITSISDWREGERDIFLQNAWWNRANCRALTWTGDDAQARRSSRISRNQKRLQLNEVFSRAGAKTS
jgi:tetratricopeptide (TPR) repeat protein